MKKFEMKCCVCNRNFSEETFRKQEISTKNFSGFVPEYWLKIDEKMYIFCGYECCNKFYLEKILNESKNSEDTKIS
jgi:hypothetical protein